MRILSIYGGPRQKGNTETMLGWLEDDLRAGGADLERVDAARLSIAGCLGCAKCHRVSDRPGCVQADDAPAVLQKIIEADAVILAAPLYAWGFPAQLKALLDRGYSLAYLDPEGQYHSLAAGRTFALVLTCAGPIEGNADICIEAFKRYVAYSGCRLGPQVVVPGTTIPPPWARRTASRPGTQQLRCWRAKKKIKE